MKEEQQAVTNPLAHLEEEVLNFWDQAKIFEKSVEKEAPKGSYVFYDGPPFGTGEPHYGHILSSVSKDVVPRYWTMNGFKVERRWGWDCHGLPIENIIEADMKISGKKQIEEMGVDVFNEACRSRVLEYADLWEVMVRRIGRWVDFKNSYKTMDTTFMESVWWGFKEMWQKDLVYEGRKVLLYCPRCETPISNFEVAMDNSYKDVTDETLYVKFKTTNAKEKLGIDGDVFVLAWTTTPWTLPSNVALAVGENIDYLVLEKENSKYIVAKERAENVLDISEYKLVTELKGSALVGLEYEQLFDVLRPEGDDKKGYYVVTGDFVTTEDGTGIVHIAPVYGEDDYQLGLRHDLPIIPTLDEKGHFTQTVPQFTGLYFKKANELVMENLESRQIVFKKEKVTHSYPHCHRCSTALFYNAIPAWFINIGKIRQRMLELNQKINWYPEHLKEGRFAKGIETAPDWNISRNRYFATPMPIWKCESCGDLEVMGSIAELKEKSGAAEITDIHNHRIDHLAWGCQCGGTKKRIKEVFDCWVESGSMPFAQMHFPFENEQKFKDNYPAQFISEYISQTRAWFYVTHVLSTALFNENSFENVVTTGVILNDKGEKMSKSKKNYPDPYKVINAYGADALRAYLMGSTVMHADNLFFNEDEVKELFRKNNMILWNVYKFYEMYAGQEQGVGSREQSESNNVLDQWILAKLDELIVEVTKSMNAYDLPRSVRPIGDFINDLSTWYIRRSRDRFKSDDLNDKNNALATTKYVLIELAKVMAPFMPFISENLWQKVTGNNFTDENRSVHLEHWPISREVDKVVLGQMEAIRFVVEAGLAKRDEVGIKIRQPLPYYSTDIPLFNQSDLDEKTRSDMAPYIEIIKDELNVMEIRFGLNELGTEMTEELLDEGMKRELVRTINNLRKNAGLTIEDRVEIYWTSSNERIASVFSKKAEELMKDTLSVAIHNKDGESDIEKQVKVNGEEAVIGLKKV
jgi:isoleucyl-tRNA synthetase